MDPTNASRGAAAERLRTLILFAGLKEETLAAARALGPEQAGEVVADLIDAELSPSPDRPSLERTALRAAQLARELGLARAAPSLVRCVEALGEARALRHAALVVLPRLGPPGADALLSALDASRDPAVRVRLAEALARFTLPDPRIRAALVRLLAEVPASAAWCLAERSEWRALPDLFRAFDRLAAHPLSDCAGCALEDLSSIACAVRVLGGWVSPDRQARMDALAGHADSVCIPFVASRTPQASPPAAPPAAPVRAPRPRRNAPCPCGSGRKFRDCCAAPPAGSERH